MSKVVIHLFHDDAASLGTGSHVAERIRQVMVERGAQLEAYVFGPAEKALMATDRPEFNQQIDALIAADVAVGTCISIAEGLGAV